MTSMRARPFGPSPEQQAGRAARLGYRQALRRRDYESALGFATAGAKLPDADIGSYEERAAEDFQERRAASAITGEVGGALGIAGRLQSRGSTLEGATGLEGARLRGAPTSPSGPVPSPTLAQPPPVKGASQIPENPVNGAEVPLTGDVRSRLSGTDQWRQDFLADAEARVKGGLYRKDAVDEINRERIAAGKAPFNRRTAISMLHNRSQLKGDATFGPDRPEPELADVPLGPERERRGVILDPRPVGPKLPAGITSRNILTRMANRQ